MRLKSFTAKTMREAMQDVREALGEEAIIVATRELKDGNVQVTAAVDEVAEAAMAAANKSFNDWVFDDDDDASSVIEDITEVMLRHAVPEEVLDDVVSYANILALDESRSALAASLGELFKFSPLPAKASDKAIMMVGQPGSGKTLAVAKMAAKGAMNGLDVAVITTDTVRAGGLEQLSAFTKLLQIDLHTADSPKALKTLLEEFSDKDQVIIDTAGVNPFEPEAVKLLARLIHAGDIEPVMVAPAGLDPDECGEMARVFATIGAQSILPTRIDVARRLGGILMAAHQGGLKFADMSNTPKVADGLTQLSPQRLTTLLMPRARTAQTSQTAGTGMQSATQERVKKAG